MHTDAGQELEASRRGGCALRLHSLGSAAAPSPVQPTGPTRAVAPPTHPAWNHLAITVDLCTASPEHSLHRPVLTLRYPCNIGAGLIPRRGRCWSSLTPVPRCNQCMYPQKDKIGYHARPRRASATALLRTGADMCNTGV